MDSAIHFLPRATFRSIMSRLPLRSKVRLMRVSQVWKTNLKQVLEKTTHLGIKTSLESISILCPEDKEVLLDSFLLVCDFKEKQLIDKILMMTDLLPNLTCIFVSPQILLRLTREQQDQLITLLFNSYGTYLACLQIPSLKMKTVEPLPKLKHMVVSSLSLKVIKALEKSAPSLESLEIMTEIRPESVVFLPRGIKKLKLRMRDESGQQLMSSCASQSITDLHLITISDVSFGGRPRSLPRLSRMRVEGNFNASFVKNLANFLSRQNSLKHLTISFVSRTRSSFLVPGSDLKDITSGTAADVEENNSCVEELVYSLHGLSFLKMTFPALNSDSARVVVDSNPGLNHLDVSGVNWNDSVLNSLSRLEWLKHLSVSIMGDTFTSEGMTSFAKAVNDRNKLTYLVLRDLSNPSVVSTQVKDLLHAMKLDKVLLCDHINWGFMII